MNLSAVELNALLQITANATISGKDAKFVAALMDKLAAMLEEAKAS